MSNYTLMDYEEAITTALEEISSLKTVKGYAGQLNDEKTFNESLHHFPAALVGIPEINYVWASNRFYRQIILIRIYVAAFSWHSQADARGESTGVAGALEDIRDKLLEKTLSLDISPIEIVKEYEIIASPQLVVYGADYKITNERLSKA